MWISPKASKNSTRAFTAENTLCAAAQHLQDTMFTMSQIKSNKVQIKSNK